MKKTGRPRSVRTPNLRRSTKAKIVRNQKRSQRKLAREAGISQTSMNRMVKKDLNMTSYKIKQRQLLDEGKKEKKDCLEAACSKDGSKLSATRSVLLSGQTKSSSQLRPILIVRTTEFLVLQLRTFQLRGGQSQDLKNQPQLWYGLE